MGMHVWQTGRVQKHRLLFRFEVFRGRQRYSRGISATVLYNL